MPYAGLPEGATVFEGLPAGAQIIEQPIPQYTGGDTPEAARREFIRQEKGTTTIMERMPDVVQKGAEGAQNALIGMGAGFYDVGKGVQQLAATAGEKIGVVSPETVKRITAEGMQAREDIAPLKKESTAATVGDFVGKVLPFVTTPGGVVGGFARRLGTSALAGAGMGLSEFVPEGESRLAKTALGAGAGAAAQGVVSAAGKGLNAFLTNPTANIAIQKLSDKFKIPVTLSELMGTGSRTDTLMERVPSVLGIGGFRKQQQTAAKSAATDNFSKYVIDPTLDTTSAMKTANDDYLDVLYNKLKATAKTLPQDAAPEVKATAAEMLNRYPDVFQSIQDTKVKRILADIVGDTADKTIPIGVLNAQGQAITRQVTPKFSFEDLWELRKGIGQAIGGAKTPTEKAQFSAVYSAVSNDMDTMLSKVSGTGINEFKVANEAFKQYSVKFDAMREAFDKAMGTTGAGTTGFFSPQKYGTALKNLANDPKYKKNVKWSPEEVNEMTGLANILQVTKRAGQYMENPPTGVRFAPLTMAGGTGAAAYSLAGLAGMVKTAGVAGTAALVTKFITTTKQGQRLALAASKVEPDSPMMAKIVNQIYNQLPKLAEKTASTMAAE